jgi:geranylgeranyl reductase family protein
MARGRNADVLVVGGGPAGSTLGWKLAECGISVIVLERANFPREKVCGDYVEPRGLRVLDAMGSLSRLEQHGPLPVTHTATYVDSTCAFRGTVPFYGFTEGLAPHGYVIPRDVLDTEMLAAAERAGALVHQGTSVSGVRFDAAGVEIEAGRGAKAVRYRGKLVVGADGANSVVARAGNLMMEDPRHIAVAQRAYATVSGVDVDVGEAAFLFDEELFPGYGWMFPIGGGRVNVGVGILAETRSRLRVHVPDLFADFIERLRRAHPQCEQLELSAPPIGGIVKTYGGHGRNHFERGLLIGDAGSFVDPMTGEGITPAMESALLAAPVIEAALRADRFDDAGLAGYDRAFRSYFDPSMAFVDLCAAILRNRYLARPWLRTLERGCRFAQQDADFARSASGYFGGLDIRPFGILGDLWLWTIRDLALVWPRAMSPDAEGATLGDLIEWQAALTRSALRDPLWHMRWAFDVQQKWTTLLADAPMQGADPRAAGLV